MLVNCIVTRQHFLPHWEVITTEIFNFEKWEFEFRLQIADNYYLSNKDHLAFSANMKLGSGR
jgi:hypothetical protein